MKSKTGFWRGFTWKRLFRFTIFYIVIFLVIRTAEILIHNAHSIGSLFTLKALGSILVKSLVIGFITTVWFEPGMDSDKANPPVIG